MAESNLFFGRNVLEEAVKNRVKISEIYYANLSAKAWVEELVGSRLKHQLGIPKELSSQSHQGVAFRAQHEFYLHAWDPEVNPYPRVLLCNHLEDVQNLGSLTRAAAAFGVDLIVHESRRSVRLNPVAVKVSAGQAFRVKFLEVSNLSHLLKSLRDEGYLLIGLDAHDEAKPLYSWRPHTPMALVLGGESSGISRPVAQYLEFNVKIPMAKEVESLNAAQAAMIAMSWIFENTSRST